MSGAFLPNEQTTSSKPANGSDKAAQGDKNSAPNNLLHPFLSQSLPSATDSQGGGQLAKTPTDWTIVADMSILFNQTGSHGHMGAEDKTALLKELKDSTKGKSVSIVLESITADGKDVPAGQDLSGSKIPYGAQMIVLRDGKEYDIPTGNSKGLKGDLQDALDFALTNQPSSHVALAINAHGMGDEGILGGTQENGKARENGRLTANELTDTIKSSLDKAHRGKLDVVDMDSCLMAEMGVLRSMNGVTKQLVASERTETVSTTDGIDGQNLTSWIGKVIANPNMTANDVSKEIVEQANRNVNGVKDHEGTTTLASFDLEHHFEEFSTKMNTLGKALNDVMQTSGNEAQIDQAIDMTPNLVVKQQYGMEVSPDVAKIDIKQFLSTLQQKLDHKSISDPENELGRAVADVKSYLDDRSSLITAVHVPSEIVPSNPFQTAKLSTGLSIYLPEQYVRQSSGYKPGFVENLQLMETGTADSDWYKFLGSVRKPIVRPGILVVKPATHPTAIQTP